MAGLSNTLLDHFRNPRNVGRPDGATGRGRAENPACGDLVELFVRVEAGIVAEAGFLCQGCSAAIGAASYVTERVRGLPVSEALGLRADQILDEVGETNPVRRHGVQMALRALAQAL